MAEISGEKERNGLERKKGMAGSARKKKTMEEKEEEEEEGEICEAEKTPVVKVPMETGDVSIHKDKAKRKDKEEEEAMEVREEEPEKIEEEKEKKKPLHPFFG